MAVVHQTPDEYVKYFDAESYAKFWYSDLSLNRKRVWETIFFMDSFRKIFEKGNIKGGSLLDVGTGPTIFSVVSACKNFENIYLSDLAPQNIEYLRKWLNDEEECHDFSSIFIYTVDKENPRESWQKRQSDLKEKIKAILSCDVSQVNPLSPNYFAQFDAITSAQCLESAAYDLVSYRKCATNLSSLIKPGGWIVLAACLGFQTYNVGDKVFQSAPIMLEDVRKTWESIGFEIDTMSAYIPTAKEKQTLLPDRSDAEREALEGICVMAARKKSDVLNGNNV